MSEKTNGASRSATEILLYLGDCKGVGGELDAVDDATKAGMLDEIAAIIESRQSAELESLRERARDFEQALTTCIGCVNAAQAEGLQEALAETTDARLADLVTRRLLWVEAHATEALAKHGTTCPTFEGRDAN